MKDVRLLQEIYCEEKWFSDLISNYKMSNLNVAVSSFWQLARHWKIGEKAKLELLCEGEKLYMHMHMHSKEVEDRYLLSSKK